MEWQKPLLRPPPVRSLSRPLSRTRRTFPARRGQIMGLCHVYLRLPLLCHQGLPSHRFMNDGLKVGPGNETIVSIATCPCAHFQPNEGCCC